jgi:hypothetical protein
MARTRARNTSGSFKGDDKSTPDVNEAWVEQTPKSENAKEPAAGNLQVTPEPSRIENLATDAKEELSPTEPVNLEVETPSSEPVAAPEATPAVKIQTDVREKLMKKSVDENVFVPANPAALEKAATEVAKDNGFELTRGTSIGARLMARAQKRV